jgi:hypothetical protein
MKKILLGLMAVVFLAGVAGAIQARRTPMDRRGDPIAHPLYGGADAVYHSGTTQQMVCTGKCLLLGVIRETGVTSTYLLLRNTISADGTLAANLVPLIHFQPDTGAHDNPIAFPVLFSAGISADSNATGAGAAILYLDLDD